MTDRIDAAMEAMQSSAAHAPRDRAPVETGLVELIYRDHAMLLRRYSGDDHVGRVAFLSHSESESTRGPNPPPWRR